MTLIESYFVVMIDHGSRGYEAVVDPALDRDAIVRLIKSGEYSDIAFIHHISNGRAETVTADLIGDAMALREAEVA